MKHFYTYLLKQAQRLYEAEDSNSSMHYITKKLANTLNLEPVKNLKISGEALLSLLGKRENIAYYAPQIRELAFYYNDFTSTKCKNNQNDLEQMRINKIIHMSSYFHEFLHHKKTQKKAHY